MPDIHRPYLAPDRHAGGLGFDLLTRHAIVLVVRLRFRQLKSSIHQSLEQGHHSEIDSMNSYVLEKSRQKNVPTPASSGLAAMIREIEPRTRPIRPENLEDLL